MYEMGRANGYWQGQLMYWAPKVIIALLILVATWIVARAVKWALQKAIDRTPALQKHTTGRPGETVGHQLGTIAKLIIWLVGIMAALQFLGIGQILTPINRLTIEIFDFLPRLIGAGVIATQSRLSCGGGSTRGHTIRERSAEETRFFRKSHRRAPVGRGEYVASPLRRHLHRFRLWLDADPRRAPPTRARSRVRVVRSRRLAVIARGG